MESAVDCDLLLYADDSALLIRGKNIIDIEQKLSEELTKLNVWLIDKCYVIHIVLDRIKSNQIKFKYIIMLLVLIRH